MGVIRLIIYKIFGLEDLPCESCEILKSQLDIANHERRQLLETIIGFTKPAVIEAAPEARIIAPIQPRTMLWKTRQQMLEENDRANAAIIAARNKEIEKLEKETGTEPVKEENAN